jgi:undecaprenyl-diphosphatase
VNIFVALILGIVQGLTEFFPVSSSFHLKIAKVLLGVDQGVNYTLFDLSCHMGTLCIVLFFLRKSIIETLTSWRKFFLVALALMPLIPVYLLIHSIRQVAYNEKLMGIYLIILALLLFYATKKEVVSSMKFKIKDVLCIGGMQTIALIPGFSRSGMTISTALLRGWSVKDAINFSFLLAIPTILGGSLLEGVKAMTEAGEEQILPFSIYVTGFCTSLLTGILPAKFIFSLTEKRELRPFAYYCFSIGIISLLYFNLF